MSWLNQPHLDIEAVQHGIDAEHILDGGIYVAVQCCVGDWGPQDAEGPVQEPQAGLHLLGLLQCLARINKGNSLNINKVREIQKIKTVLFLEISTLGRVRQYFYLIYSKLFSFKSLILMIKFKGLSAHSDIQ